MKREEKKAQTRQRIAESAVELFELQGYEATTVQQIADRAEVAKGTFFNYYNSKEDLMLDLQSKMIMKEIESIAGKPGPVIPRLQVMLHEFARNYPMNRPVTRAVLQSVYGSEKLRDFHCECCEEFIAALTPTLEIAQQKGEIRSDIPAKTISQLAVQTYFGVLMSWAIEQGEPELADQMALTFEVFIRGMAP
ncbi:TetR/AcrR family transcriptional regulator [Cohnella sp. CFH 77786]|uniref:TetR/AcrR family transcriptional regulator n=1 Tax=Cohnella sp. CFH 77786 TaxID=2662265 RepID=UPI001C61034D|nr:TetR/AcrR family transcriptional regulator [Cohnella sp. CFH 77786]